MKWKICLSWFLVVALCGLTVRQTTAQTESEPFGALILQEGLPLNFPLAQGVQKKLKNIQHIAIPIDRASHFILYYAGETNDESQPSRWLWHSRPDSTGTLKGVSFNKNEEGFLTAEFDLYTDRSETAVMTLELRLLPENKVVLYRWDNAEGGAVGGTVATRPVDRPIMVGKMAPGFTAEKLEGNTVSLDNLKGKHVVINTWAISCSPCIAEMPGLNQLVEKYKEENFVFLALGYDSNEDIHGFLRTQDFKYEQALFNEEVSQLFGEVFPRNVIINAEGLVVYDRLGANEEQYKELDEVIQEKILNQK